MQLRAAALAGAHGKLWLCSSGFQNLLLKEVVAFKLTVFIIVIDFLFTKESQALRPGFHSGFSM